MEIYVNEKQDYLIKLSDVIDGRANIKSFIRSFKRDREALFSFVRNILKECSIPENMIERYGIAIDANSVDSINIYLLNEQVMPSIGLIPNLENKLNFVYYDTVNFEDYYKPHADISAEKEKLIQRFAQVITKEATLCLIFYSLDDVIKSTRYLYRDLKNSKVYRYKNKYVIYVSLNEISGEYIFSLGEFCDVEAVAFSNIAWNEHKYINTYKNFRKVEDFEKKN